MPPSPSLSAFITNKRYLIVTTSTNDQTIRERMPKTLSGVTVNPCDSWKHSRSAYRGLVPMSPYTTPMAATASEMGGEDSLVCFGMCFFTPTERARVSVPGRLPGIRASHSGESLDEKVARLVLKFILINTKRF